MPNETWNKGYKEVKNVIHNEIGITKEEILDVFRHIAKDEVRKILSENRSTLHEIFREVVLQELIKSVQEHRYPKVSRNVWNYTEKHAFEDYLSGVLKEEIIEMLRSEFQVNLQITNVKSEKNEVTAHE